ncbi:Scr1 family TA system antitoxin-like transcriptional regulator [Streptomyces sp. NPDC056821]|uniref:Scr1 family TA system antitoxin-like transcriptional regulator n=1 Tax=unclassified Streptomyces TaxID=2593676 RepID=UPI0036BAB3E3
MGQRKDIDGSAGVPTFYGKELRWKREEAGLTLQQLVEGSFYGPSHLSEIERGERRMPAELAEHVDQALGTDGFFERRCEDVRNAKRRGHARYFERVLEAERHAETIEEWCPTLIPGLLQTDSYARAVVRATHPLAPDDEVEEKVAPAVKPLNSTGLLRPVRGPRDDLDGAKACAGQMAEAQAETIRLLKDADLPGARRPTEQLVAEFEAGLPFWQQAAKASDADTFLGHLRSVNQHNGDTHVRRIRELLDLPMPSTPPTQARHETPAPGPV